MFFFHIWTQDSCWTLQAISKKNYRKDIFSDTINSLDIEEEIMKQIKMLKSFNMEHCKA